MLDEMFGQLRNRLRVARLNRAIRLVERCGLAVVQVRHADGAVYLIAADGAYVRFDKVKTAKGKKAVRVDG